MKGRYQYEKAAHTIMVWLHLAEDDLVGHSVVLTGGETGVVQELRLDDHHGLCFTLDSATMPALRRWYPVSVIKLHGPKQHVG